jgi:hypothetical protein
MYMSGRSIVATFWPTVGTVFPAVVEAGASPVAPSAGSAEDELVLKVALIWLRNVVLPALSRPRRMIEYSV